MTTNLRNRNRASLGGVFFSTCMSLTLAACSGGEDGDEPAASAEPGDERETPAADSDDRSTRAPADGDEGSSGEGNPAVADRDPGTSADETSDPDAEASQTPDAPLQSLDVPATDHCADVADWDPEWVQFEEEVLLLVNEFRSQPADCGEEGEFSAAPPLTMDATLRCSARLHSVDMFERDYFAHDNPDGLDPFQRMQEAGFEGQRMGENIAQGQTTPEEVMQAWMESDGHCANIMLAAYEVIGIGYDPGAQQRGAPSNFWTQNFGTRFQRRSR
jgi:uncharacterized protein YkwD